MFNFIVVLCKIRVNGGRMEMIQDAVKYLTGIFGIVNV